MSCPICLNEEIVDKYTTTCNHDFCKCCIDTWLEHKNTCPLCRNKLKEEGGVKYSLSSYRYRLSPSINQVEIEVSSIDFENGYLTFDFPSIRDELSTIEDRNSIENETLTEDEVNEALRQLREDRQRIIVD